MGGDSFVSTWYKSVKILPHYCFGGALSLEVLVRLAAIQTSKSEKNFPKREKKEDKVILLEVKKQKKNSVVVNEMR